MAHSTQLKINSTIVLIHPSTLFSEGLSSLLEDTPYKLTLRVASFETVNVEALRPQGKLVFLVGGGTGAQIVETVRGIRDRLRSAYIVVISATSEPSEVLLTLEAGASGYLREAMTSQTLITAIELVMQDETILPAEFVKSLPGAGARPVPESLTGEGVLQATQNDIQNGDSTGNENTLARIRLSAREETILRDLVDGAPNKVIGQRLSITEATVKVHVKAILRKIRVKNRTQAAIWAIKHLAIAEEQVKAP